jgi:hypothetical protein
MERGTSYTMTQPGGLSSERRLVKERRLLEIRTSSVQCEHFLVLPPFFEKLLTWSTCWTTLFFASFRRCALSFVGAGAYRGLEGLMLRGLSFKNACLSAFRPTV